MPEKPMPRTPADTAAPPFDPGHDPWETVQLCPPGPNCTHVGFMTDQGTVLVLATDYVALQQVTWEAAGDDPEETETRIVPVVALETGVILPLEKGDPIGGDFVYTGALGTLDTVTKRLGAMRTQILAVSAAITAAAAAATPPEPAAAAPEGSNPDAS